MQRLRILNTREKKAVLDSLKQTYGFYERLEGVLFLSSKQKLYLLTGGFNLIMAGEEKQLRIDRIGVYIGKIMPDGIRLSIEGSQIIGRRARKNVLLISNNHLKPWVKGEDFLLSPEEDEQVRGREGYFIIRHGSDFLGCARIKQRYVQNLLSKNRRIKTLNI
ncbi:MAG TPA: hypothetical protein ENL16_01545 [Candidatus Woesearchaeota archaeon]|nr:hypothetical protein [Candidatus Woesearchaeota archaeon]